MTRLSGRPPRRSFAASLVAGTLDLIFAPACAVCREPMSTRAPDRLVCRGCWARSRTIPIPRCERCWTPIPQPAGESPTCPLCADLRPAIRSVRSAFLHSGPIRSMVHALKYRCWHTLARPMAARMAQTPASEEVRLELNVVVPVPLSPARRRQRGYNQAELLASEIASILGLPVETAALERRARSTTQTTLHPDQRRANVAGAFHLREQGSTLIAAKHVLLVDDVWTTGATARACAETLLAGGARGISVLTFARAMPEFESNAKRIEQLANY